MNLKTHLIYLFFPGLFSCQNENIEKMQSIHHQSPALRKYELKTFEVTDTSSSACLGWGYDIYVDGNLTIHQPFLPGISGNHPFSSEEKAKKTGDLAIVKMQKFGGLPAITPEDLDSLNITN